MSSEKKEIPLSEVMTELGPRQLGKDARGEPCLVYIARVQNYPEQWIGPAVNEIVMACAVVLELHKMRREVNMGFIQVCISTRQMENVNPLLGWGPEALANWLKSDPENVNRVNAACQFLKRLAG